MARADSGHDSESDGLLRVLRWDSLLGLSDGTVSVGLLTALTSDDKLWTTWIGLTEWTHRPQQPFASPGPAVALQGHRTNLARV